MVRPDHNITFVTAPESPSNESSVVVNLDVPILTTVRTFGILPSATCPTWTSMPLVIAWSTESHSSSSFLRSPGLIDQAPSSGRGRLGLRLAQTDVVQLLEQLAHLHGGKARAVSITLHYIHLLMRCAHITWPLDSEGKPYRLQQPPIPKFFPHLVAAEPSSTNTAAARNRASFLRQRACPRQPNQCRCLLHS